MHMNSIYSVVECTRNLHRICSNSKLGLDSVLWLDFGDNSISTIVLNYLSLSDFTACLEY